MAASRSKLLEMAEKDKERMMLEESKNKVESYIYRIKNKLSDDEVEIESVTTKKQREEVRKLAEEAEDWLYEDGYSADLATMEDKYAELSVPFEKIMLRISEKTARPEAIEALQTKLTEIEALMAKWEESKPQVTEEERKSVLDKVEEVRKWIDDKEKQQSKKKPHDEPAFLSEEVPLQIKPIQSIVVRLNKKPKPKPEKKQEEDKNETSTENATDTKAEASAGGGNETLDDKETAKESDAKTEDDTDKTTSDDSKQEDNSEEKPAVSEELQIRKF